MKAPHNSGILLNPNGRVLGTQNAILSGSGTRYHVPDFEGCLSIKSVISGSVVWETPGRRYEVHENTYLLLNDGQHYTMTIDSARKATTFCIFFERGFVEDVFRAGTSPTSKLLDRLEPAAAEPLAFVERIEPQGPIQRELQRLKKRLTNRQLSSDGSTEDLFRLAERLLAEHRQTSLAISRLPAVRSATREELFRRVLRGRDFLLSSLSDSISLNDAARAACLSPFHFHRAFQCAFGVTPHRYAIRHRLERARHLLRATDCSVTEICLETGFESLGSFSSLFRRTYGLAPSDCRPKTTNEISNIREVEVSVRAQDWSVERQKGGKT
jgi:AraC family transcriptional regulator